MTTPKVAFVAGATGYTGREVVAELVAAGVRTIAHVRPDSASGARWAKTFAEKGAEVDRTAWHAEAMARTLQQLQPDVVFALLGTTRSRARKEGMTGEEGYDKVDYGLTRVLLDAAASTGSNPRFVYLSSLGVEPRTKNPYLAARARVEADLRESELPWTVGRPSFVTGADREESRPAERIGAIASDALLGVTAVLGLGRWAARYRSMTGRQLAHALVHAALDPEAVGRVLEAADLRSRMGDGGSPRTTIRGG